MPWQHKTLARMDFLCEPWRRLTPCLFLHRFLLTDQIWDRNLVLGAVEKQCSLLFCGSVVFNLRLAGGHRERWRQERERKAGARRRESQWFPQAPVSIVSPVAHLTHSLCWAMGKSDWAHYPLLRTDTGSVRRARERERASYPAHCEWTPLPVLSLSGMYGHLPRLTWLSSASLPLCGGNKWALSPCPGAVMDVVSWDYWHALSHPLGRVLNEKEWMADTVKGM